MKNSEIITQYCENKLLNKTGFSQYMKEYPNFIYQLIKKDLLNSEQEEILAYQKSVLYFQLVKNKLFEEEIKLFNKQNIEFVGLKGIFLQWFYYPTQHIRLFNDIDIQVKDNLGLKFYQMLIKYGYRILKEPDRPLIYKKKLFIDKLLVPLNSIFFKNRHHAELEKTTQIDNQNIYIDLHGNLFLTKNSPKQQMITNAVEKHFKEMEIKIFAPEDNIIFLMFHSIKHIGYVNLARDNLGINLQDFYDIAQIISIENINWKNFILTIEAYDYLVPMASLFLKIFTSIYNNLIPEWVFVELQKRAETLKFHWKPIYLEAMKMNSEDLIIGSYQTIPFLYAHWYKLKNSNIEPDYIWASWALFYTKLSIKKMIAKYKNLTKEMIKRNKLGEQNDE